MSSQWAGKGRNGENIFRRYELQNVDESQDRRSYQISKQWERYCKCKLIFLNFITDDVDQGGEN